MAIPAALAAQLTPEQRAALERATGPGAFGRAPRPIRQTMQPMSRPMRTMAEDLTTGAFGRTSGPDMLTLSELAPGTGDAMAFGDAFDAAQQGAFGRSLALNTLAALGLAPVIGGAIYKGGRKALDAATQSVRNLRTPPVLQIGGTPLPGAPNPANIPNVGRVQFGPNPEVEAAARRATEAAGVQYRPVTRYTPIDRRIADTAAREYGLLQHNPSDPTVASAYQKMIDEMMPQFDAMVDAGITPYFSADPSLYSNSPYEALMDIAQNRRLGVYPTRAGFGSDATFDPTDNPLLGDSGRLIGGVPALYNDVFRAVHDFYGHGKSGVGFRAMGEENAYQSHAGMFSPEARRAVASETRGQNSFLNFGPFGEINRTASIENTRFADQKTGLMPRYVSEAGLVINDDRRQRFFDTLRQGDPGGLSGAVTDDGKLRLIHYSPRELERIEPDRFGQNLSRNVRSEQNRARGNPDFVNRSYYGIPASQNPYRPELGVGTVKHEIEVEPELMYDLAKDPEQLRAQSMGDVTVYEKLISNSGYTGYFRDHPQLGKVAAIFDPYDVKKVYTIPVLGVGVAGLSGVEEEKDEQI